MSEPRRHGAEDAPWAGEGWGAGTGTGRRPSAGEGRFRPETEGDRNSTGSRLHETGRVSVSPADGACCSPKTTRGNQRIKCQRESKDMWAHVVPSEATCSRSEVSAECKEGLGSTSTGCVRPAHSSLRDSEKVPAPSSAVNGIAPDLPQRHLGRRLAHGKPPPHRY